MILATTTSIVLTLCPALNVQQRGPDVLDAESTRAIRELTTDEAYLTEWVDHIPESETVPSPRDFLGYVVGTPKRLTRPERIVAYFRELDRTTDRVRLFSMGRSHGGREMILAAVGDASLLDRMDEILAANRRLADPRTTDLEEARAISTSIPPTYWITAGLHSPETGPPEMVMELAYRLVVSEQDHIREIRSNVLTLISPVLEMDGRARMVDWYYRYLTEVTDLEDSPPSSPPYWGDYTFHDNNRDGLQVSQPLTRNCIEFYHRFLPTVSLDLHESVPLLYVSTGTGPYNEVIDPIAITEWQWLASYDVTQATRLGLPGVWTWGFYTGWYPGYLLWITNNHNSVGRFYETFGNSNAGTFVRKLKDARYADRRVNSRQWYRPWPPEKEVRWSLRNNTNYMQTGVLAALQLAARNGDTLLLNFWKKGFNSLERGRNEAPYAFHVPAAQRDKGSLNHFLWLLAQHRIEVHRAGREIQLSDDVTIPLGDFVVRMDQPYRNFAKTLLSRQKFPKTAEQTPYDDVAWSLDLMLGLEIHAIDDPEVLGAELERVETPPEILGEAQRGSSWVVNHRGQSSLAAFRFALGEDVEVRALGAAWEGHPAGSLWIEGVDHETVAELTRAYRIDAVAVSGPPDVELIDVNLPRVALFHTWSHTQDSGWARYTLEQIGIPFELIHKDDLRAGGLRDAFDVILVPSQGRLDFKGIVHGLHRKWSPMPYTKTDDYPSHGVIDSAEDITGGMGFQGLAHLEEFIEGGGLLITLGSAGVLATDGGLALEADTRARAGTPGSHLATRVLRPEHPVTFGYDESTHVFRGNFPRYVVPEQWQGMVLMQYGHKTRRQVEDEADRKAEIPVAAAEGAGDEEAAEKEPICLSGILPEPSEIERLPAILDVIRGEGRVLIFSWNPFHRYQNHHDFAFVTNAILFHDDFPGTPTEEEMLERESR